MHSLHINYSLKPWHHQCWLRHWSVFCRSLAPPSSPPFKTREDWPWEDTQDPWPICGLQTSVP